MSVCTFFGHRECYGLDAEVLRSAIKDLISQGVTEFLVGHQGQFDGMVRSCLRSLQTQYPNIRYSVVLAYLPTEKREFEDLSDTMYPEIEGHPRFAIERRNKWMIEASDCCICYINHTWGGAYKFARMAMRRGLKLRNLGSATIEWETTGSEVATQ